MIEISIPIERRDDAWMREAGCQVRYHRRCGMKASPAAIGQIAIDFDPDLDGVPSCDLRSIPGDPPVDAEPP